MEEKKRQRLIETLFTIGSLVGIFLAIFQMSSYVLTTFSVFILFSLIYYISVLDNYKKVLHNLFVAFMISVSFSGLFVILLARGMTDMFQLVELTVVYGVISFLLTIELSGYCFDVKVVKKEECKKL
jgi:hypothetical protein